MQSAQYSENQLYSERGYSHHVLSIKSVPICSRPEYSFSGFRCLEPRSGKSVSLDGQWRNDAPGIKILYGLERLSQASP